MTIYTALRPKLKNIIADLPQEKIVAAILPEYHADVRKGLSGQAIFAIWPDGLFLWTAILPTSQCSTYIEKDDLLPRFGELEASAVLGMEDADPFLVVYSGPEFKPPVSVIPMDLASERYRPRDIRAKRKSFPELVEYFTEDKPTNRVIAFSLRDSCTERLVTGALVVQTDWFVSVHLDGYGDCVTYDGTSQPILFEFNKGEIRALAWNDITEDDCQAVSIMRAETSL